MKVKEKKLIILDLDETLIHSSEKVLQGKSDFKVGQYFVYKRPYLDWFLHILNKKFSIGIWSAAKEDYVLEIIKNIIPSDFTLELLWDQRWCEKIEINDGVLYEKKLTKVQNLLKINEKGILLIDDSIHNVKSNKGRALLIKPFAGCNRDNELNKIGLKLITETVVFKE